MENDNTQQESTEAQTNSDVEFIDSKSQTTDNQEDQQTQEDTVQTSQEEDVDATDSESQMVDNQEDESSEYVEEESIDDEEVQEFTGGQDVQNFNWLRGQFSNLLHSFCEKYELNYDDVMAGKYQVMTDEGLLIKKLNLINDNLTNVEYAPMVSMQDCRIRAKGKPPALVSEKEEEKPWFANYILLNYGCNQQELMSLQNSREGVKEGSMNIEDLDDPRLNNSNAPTPIRPSNNRLEEGDMRIEDLDDPDLIITESQRDIILELLRKHNSISVPQRGREGKEEMDSSDESINEVEREFILDFFKDYPSKENQGIDSSDEPINEVERDAILKLIKEPRPVLQRGKESNMMNSSSPINQLERDMILRILKDCPSGEDQELEREMRTEDLAVRKHLNAERFQLYKKTNLFKTFSESEIFDKLKNCFYKPATVLAMLNIKEEFDPIASSKFDEFYTALISSELFSEEANDYLRTQWSYSELIMSTFFEAKDILEEMAEHNIAYTYEKKETQDESNEETNSASDDEGEIS